MNTLFSVGEASRVLVCWNPLKVRCECSIYNCWVNLLACNVSSHKQHFTCNEILGTLWRLLTVDYHLGGACYIGHSIGVCIQLCNTCVVTSWERRFWSESSYRNKFTPAANILAAGVNLLRYVLDKKKKSN